MITGKMDKWVLKISYFLHVLGILMHLPTL
jgi:hypothetical protein